MASQLGSDETQGSLFSPADNQKKPKSMFAGKQDHSIEIGNIGQQLNDCIIRLRVLEERYSSFQRRAQLSDQNYLRLNKRFNEEIKGVIGDISEIKMFLDEIKEKVILMINELKSTPKKEEFQVLKKYIEMWEPMNFVTRKEVASIVQDILDRRQEDPSPADK